nr:putative ribonuclease H-like domain-containing protein [Tanacetum cinerariifolium]
MLVIFISIVRSWVQQEEGIDYDEVFAPVTRTEAIRLFLAYALFKDFVMYQMDMKSAFLYGKIKEEVYVCQPPGFEDPNFPNRIYKVEKALYRLPQTLRAWYETLSTYLLDSGFQRCTIDKTLFIKKEKSDILLVQVYVDDIIFGSTRKEMCTEFEQMMHKKFQMSSMGELTFFLGVQVKQKEDGIFISQDKYLKGQPMLGLWYPKDSPFDLVAYTISDYVGASLDRKSIAGDGMSKHNEIYLIPSHTKKIFSNMKRVGKDISGKETPLFPIMMVQAQEDMGEVLAIPTDPHHTPTITQPSTSKPQKKQKLRKQRRHDTEETHPSGLGDNVADEAFNVENTYKVGLRTRIESSNEEQSLGEEDASKQERNIADIDVDAEITLVNETTEDRGRFNDQEMFDTRVFDDEEVVVKKAVVDKEVSVVKEVDASQDQKSKPKADKVVIKQEQEQGATTTTTTIVTIYTPASTRPKVRSVVMQELSETTTTTTQIKAKDKGKGIMVKEPLKMKKKDQIIFDHQEDKRLQAEINEEERLAGERSRLAGMKAQQEKEANIALIESWHEVQDKMEADYELAQRLQAEEQEQLTNGKKTRLFMDFLDKRRKFFAAKREIEKRYRPTTKAQQKSLMSTYLKNMDGWKPKDLKTKSFAKIQRLFGNSKRACEEIEQEISKRQKVDDNQETAELKRCLEIVPNNGDDVTIDATHLSSKSPTIVDYKIYKEERNSYFQIIRAYDRKSKAGKRYGFVRFIRVYDVDRLVRNLCTLWMGSHHLHANVARFMRPPAVKSGGYTHQNGLLGKVKEFISFDNMRMVLGNEGLNEIDLRYMGGAASWFSQIIQASKEFVIDERITWVDIEGIPLKLLSESTFNRIAEK